MKASIKCSAKEDKGGNKTKEERRRKSDNFAFCVCRTSEGDILNFISLSSYCETNKTVNTRNIYGMLLCCEK